MEQRDTGAKHRRDREWERKRSSGRDGQREREEREETIPDARLSICKYGVTGRIRSSMLSAFICGFEPDVVGTAEGALPLELSRLLDKAT